MRGKKRKKLGAADLDNQNDAEVLNLLAASIENFKVIFFINKFCMTF